MKYFYNTKRRNMKNKCRECKFIIYRKYIFKKDSDKTEKNKQNKEKKRKESSSSTKNLK